MRPSPNEPDFLVDPAWIAAHLDDPRVVLIELDVGAVAYGEGHIPGAVFWNAYGDLRDSSYLPVDRAELGRFFSRAGIEAGSTLVFYGYGAVLGFWLAKWQGHDDVRLLDGDRNQWTAAGNQWSTEVPEPRETAYEFAPEVTAIQASQAEVSEALADPETVLLDVRSELEFEGERFWPSGATADAGRAGHLPGALNLPIERLREEDGSLKGPAHLRAVCEEAGLEARNPVIVYCTIGNRASQAWFALSQLLGYPDVRVYYGSWVEWGKQSDTAID